MFTIKAIKECGHEKVVYSAMRYAVCEPMVSKEIRDFPLTMIYVYPNNSDNCEVINLLLRKYARTSNEESEAFYEAFIENQSGKTIDRYRAAEGRGNQEV